MNQMPAVENSVMAPPRLIPPDLVAADLGEPDVAIQPLT
jgi:hypothetical protein